MKHRPGMKEIIKIVWFYISIWLVIVFILSSLSSFIKPSSLSFISVLGLGFPYILATFFIFIIINFFVRRKLAYFMLIFLPFAYFNTVNTVALRTEATWQPQKDSSTLRVMTWNVQSFANYLHRKKTRSAYRTTREETLALIHNYNPDVLCFQEYRNIENAKRRIAIKEQLDSLGYKYYFCSNDKIGSLPKNQNVTFENGVAIYSKLPLIDSARININHSDRIENLIYCDILLNNKPVRIYTAHLQSFTIYEDTAQKNQDQNIYEVTYKRRKSAQYKIRETEVKHQEEAAIIRKAIDSSNHPVIYCGDLNTTPTSYNYRYLKGNNLQDAFIKKGSGIGNTFYKLGPTLRIDVCLVDTALQVLQCKREKRKLSDHYPVITDVKWK
jgi:endonuclease/exonuclease/phosphatase family metal-dependent hydrolase